MDCFYSIKNFHGIFSNLETMMSYSSEQYETFPSQHLCSFVQVLKGEEKHLHQTVHFCGKRTPTINW